MKRILAILPVVLLAACHRQEAKLEKPITPVRVTPVETYRPKGAGRYSASILPGRQATLAFRVSGVVASVNRVGGRNLEAGDIVAAGTVLARLREEDYRIANAQSQSQVDAARQSEAAAAAQIAQAQASHAKAQADFARAKTLFEQQSLTRPDYDAARAQLDVAAAQVEAARAQAAAAAAQIRTAEAGAANTRLAHGDTALAAPFAASIVQRNVDVGMLAGPSQPAFTLADIGTVKAAFGVPDTVVVNLRPGAAMDVEVDALPGRDFRGTVSTIAAVADAETRLFQVEVALANPSLTLKPGMIASLRLGDAAAAAPVPVVPLSAVIRDRENPSQFAVMVVENKIARARSIELGPTFGDVLAINRGLKPGELVIRAGATLVMNGEAVEVIP
jgi:multidrug efflux system membrane fusion protein